MQGLTWIPQVKSNNTSMKSANRMKTSLLTNLKLKYISRKEDNFAKWRCIFEY